jgi:hypothetical protein
MPCFQRSGLGNELTLKHILMQIDHIFIFSKNNGAEADELVEFGFTEGSSRIHPGQGTINRKFYFENFFLEILWVINAEEIQSELILPTKLWQRSHFKINKYSPFGMCLINEDNTDKLFKNCVHYQPLYFPEGMKIEVITNENNPYLPWTFRLPFKGIKKKPDEPTNHKNGMLNLTHVEFNVQSIENEYVANFEGESAIKFTENQENNLILTFDNYKNDSIKTFSGLPLVIKF